jgi:hypothetical protein
MSGSFLAEGRQSPDLRVRQFIAEIGHRLPVVE